MTRAQRANHAGGAARRWIMGPLAGLMTLAWASLALAGCGGVASTQAHPTTPASTATASATATTAPTATPAGPTTCATSQLALAVASTGDASGHERVVYQLTNTGSSACTLNGYPGVTGMPSSVAITQTTSAYMWNTATIATQTLAAGGSAVFAVQDQPTAEVSGQTCATATPSFTPPGGASGLASPVAITTCDGTLSISPIVATPNDL